MGFLKPDKPEVKEVSITVKIKCPVTQIERVGEDLQKICDNLMPSEISVVRRISEKPTVKNMALRVAESYL